MSVPAWSFSSIKLFKTCPRKYEAERITKEVKFTDTEATLYGTAVHLAAEEFIRDGKEIPPQFSYIQPVLEKLKALPGEKHCEIKFGIALRDGQMVACDFFAPDVWFRGVADLFILNGNEARVIDYKTSKNAKYADTTQLALMAACVFLNYPEVKVVKAGLLFLVCKDFVKETYTFDDRNKVFITLGELLTRREIAYESGVFNATPNGLCKAWCEVLSCPHNGRH